MRLEKFLCCFDLEMGGSVIGFYHLIIYCFMVLVSVISFFVAIFYAEAEHLIFILPALVIAIVIYCFLIYISYHLVLGVELRDHQRVQMFRILSIVIIICSFVVGTCLALAILFNIQFTEKEIEWDPRIKVYHKILMVIYLIITFFVQIYIFLIIDSLHKRFREEENFPKGVQYGQ